MNSVFSFVDAMLNKSRRILASGLGLILGVVGSAGCYNTR
jgi:hypothetical protein